MPQLAELLTKERVQMLAEHLPTKKCVSPVDISYHSCRLFCLHRMARRAISSPCNFKTRDVDNIWRSTRGSFLISKHLFCLLFSLKSLPPTVLQLRQALIVVSIKMHYFNTNAGVRRVIENCLNNMISSCILLTHFLWPFFGFLSLLTDVFTPQMTSCSWRSMRASSRLPFRRSSLGEQPHFKRKWIILWNEWRHVPESQLAQNSLSFPPSISVSPSLLLSSSGFRISLQLENSKRRKEALQDTVVASPYVSCHDLIAWVFRLTSR